MSSSYSMPGPWPGGWQRGRAPWLDQLQDLVAMAQQHMAFDAESGPDEDTRSRGHEHGRGHDHHHQHDHHQRGERLHSDHAQGDRPHSGRGRPGRSGRRGGHGRGGFGPGGGFPFGGFPGPMFGRGGPRVGRGDVRTALLVLLAEEPMHGYQMIRELGERSGGAWRPSPGSVYPTLQQLEDEGLVRVETTDGRRIFHLTDAGRAVAAERNADEPAPWDTVSHGVDDGVRGLYDVVMQVGAASIQVARAGTPDQVEQARVALADVRRGLYRILAEGEPETDGGESTNGSDSTDG
jgi:DNA-binding PadR family transcriptional regulator